MLLSFAVSYFQGFNFQSDDYCELRVQLVSQISESSVKIEESFVQN